MRSEIIDYIKAYAAKIIFGSVATYETIPFTSSLADSDIPSWANVKAFSGEPIQLSAAPGDGSLMVMSADELTSINALVKYPEMVVTGIKSGSRYTQNGYTDVFYDYEGTPGFFTYFAINLHDNGSGENLDAMNIQLS